MAHERIPGGHSDVRDGPQRLTRSAVAGAHREALHDGCIEGRQIGDRGAGREVAVAHPTGEPRPDDVGALVAERLQVVVGVLVAARAVERAEDEQAASRAVPAAELVGGRVKQPRHAGAGRWRVERFAHHPGHGLVVQVRGLAEQPILRSERGIEARRRDAAHRRQQFLERGPIEATGKKHPHRAP